MPCSSSKQGRQEDKGVRCGDPGVAWLGLAPPSSPLNGGGADTILTPAHDLLY